MSDLVFGVVSIYDHPELVPHFLEHYLRLGVTGMLLAVRSEQALPLTEQYVKEVGFGSISYFPAERFDDKDKVNTEERVLATQTLNQDDYILHLDLDEFQQYPAPLTEIVTEMNRHDDLAVSCWMVDRVAADGRLRPMTRTPTIWEQFPCGVDFSATVLRAGTRKIMICRRRVKLKGGGRHNTVDVSYTRKPVPGEYIVHHFKWLEGLDARLERRLRRDSLEDPYRDECCRFLDYYGRFGGRISLDDPALNVRNMPDPFAAVLPTPRVE